MIQIHIPARNESLERERQPCDSRGDLHDNVSHIEYTEQVIELPIHETQIFLKTAQSSNSVRDDSG
jgi:hypothetical protein